MSLGVFQLTKENMETQSTNSRSLERTNVPFNVDEYLTSRDNPKSLVKKSGSRVRLLTQEVTEQGQPVFFCSLFDKEDKFQQVVWISPKQANKRFN